MAQTKDSRKRFIDSVVSFLKRYDFDGFDLDWEYPANRGGAPEDKKNFALLVREFREEFDEYGYTLSAAVSAGEAVIRSAYDVPTMSRL
jgi:chitinase